MPIGDLRVRISIVADVRAEDDYGGAAVTQQVIALGWANIKPLLGREQVEAMQVRPVQQYRVTIRYRADIDRTMRVMWGAKKLNILAVNNPDQKERYLEMLCEEVG